MEGRYKIDKPKSSIDNAAKVVFEDSVRKITAGELVDYDLFLYKMKDRELFYYRDHPVDINPKSLAFKKYWNEFAIKAIEGIWVDDKGTWVYMMPKLFYYINYVEITGSLEGDEKNREMIKPDLSTLEWLLFSYMLVAEGFSGFKNDKEFTCNRLVEKLYNGQNLYSFETLPDDVFRPNGSLKVFVDPWEYLTRFYLVDNPRGNLGEPLYQNSLQNVVLSGSRGVAKSYVAYAGDFLHEWTFGGIKKYDDRAKSATKYLFGMGAAHKEPLNKSAALVKDFYDSQPGKYEYPIDNKPDYMGPFFKKAQGTWENGKTVKHIVKAKNNMSVIKGSLLQLTVLTADKKRIGSGDRFRRIYVEEAGLIQYLPEIHATNKDSLKVGRHKVGIAFYTGTAGDLQAVEGIKKIILNPKGYDTAYIPNYWKNSIKDIGMFISAMWRFRGMHDGQGNRNLQESLQFLADERIKNAMEMDSATYDEEVLNAPVNPDEMLRPNRKSFLPSKQATDRKADIEDYGYYDLHTQIGDLIWDSNEKYGVGFKRDSKMRAISDYNIDKNKIDIEGAYAIFEQPPAVIPDNLNYVIFDPVSNPGKGLTLDASLNVAFVYKGFWTGSENTLEDNIVAEWVGRMDSLDDTYERVIKLAMYYNAKIFPEMHTPGFVDYCKRNGYFHMLQEEAYLAEREINPKYRKKGAVGFTVYGDKKTYLIQLLKQWLLRKRGFDPLTGEYISLNIDHIISKRFLDEIINYKEDGNFDYISAALGMVLLRQQLTLDPIPLQTEPKIINPYEVYTKPTKKRRRSAFEQSAY